MPIPFRTLLLLLALTLGLSTVSLAHEREGSAASADAEGDDDTKPGITGDWFGTRTWAANRGITFSTSYTAEVLGNLRGGFHTGTVYDALLLMGVNFDLSQILGWSGATFHTSIC